MHRASAERGADRGGDGRGAVGRCGGAEREESASVSAGRNIEGSLEEIARYRTELRGAARAWKGNSYEGHTPQQLLRRPTDTTCPQLGEPRKPSWDARMGQQRVSPTWRCCWCLPGRAGRQAGGRGCGHTNGACAAARRAWRGEMGDAHGVARLCGAYFRVSFSLVTLSLPLCTALSRRRIFFSNGRQGDGQAEGYTAEDAVRSGEAW